MIDIVTRLKCAAYRRLYADLCSNVQSRIPSISPGQAIVLKSQSSPKAFCHRGLLDGAVQRLVWNGISD